MALTSMVLPLQAPWRKKSVQGMSDLLNDELGACVVYLAASSLAMEESWFCASTKVAWRWLVFFSLLDVALM
jgi:hypothetical protein